METLKVFRALLEYSATNKQLSNFQTQKDGKSIETFNTLAK